MTHSVTKLLTRVNGMQSKFSTVANALTIVAGVPQIPLDASTWDPTTTLDLLQQMSTALRVLLSLSRNTQQAPAVFVLMAVCLDSQHVFTSNF